MKNLLIFSLFLLTTSLLSCKKDSDTATTPTPTEGAYLRMNVNGQLVEHNTGEAFVDLSVNQLVINFYTPNGNPGQLNILIDQDDTPITTTTYDPTISSTSYMSYLKGADYSKIYSVSLGDDGSSGVVQVTELKNIGGGFQAAKGTFSGTFVNAAGESVQITAGEFKDGRF